MQNDSSEQALACSHIFGRVRVSLRIFSCLAILAVLLPPHSALAALPTPNQPILIVQDSTASDPYQNFVPELLKTEGLNGFQTAQLADLTASFLANYDIVILPHLTLSAAQATLFQNYVSAGGTLIGFRPDKQLANVFGLATQATTISEGWLKIDTTKPYGAGLESQVMKFHGTADVYSLNGASSLATLYQNANSPTTSPAVALSSFGNGKGVLFAFDLTQSIVLMRQGNPAWAGYPNNHDGFLTMRPSQMFMDVSTGSFWNDLGDGALNDVPQADQQLHVLANVILLLNAARRPLPRLWYFPSQTRAMVLVTGDHHGDPESNSVSEINTVQSFGGLFEEYLWDPFGEIGSNNINNWLAAGHGFGVHFNDTAESDSSGAGGSRLTWSGMQSVMSTGLADLQATYPSVPAPKTNRNHFLAWVSNNSAGARDQTAQAKLFQNFGIQMDTTYSAFPNRWGYMTGSGLPMKFLDTTAGTVIPVYEQATQYEDDIQMGSSAYSLLWDLPTAQSHYQRSISDSVTKYNTVVTFLFHPDHWTDYQDYATAALQYAQSNAVPIWSANKWNAFWVARAAATLSNPSFASNTVSFTVNGANAGLTLLIPQQSGPNVIAGVNVDGSSQSFNLITLQGVSYAAVTLTAGNHSISASYSPGANILGQISPAGAATGTTIQVQGGPGGAISQTATAAGDGTYSVGPLPSGTYTVTPNSPAYIFSPASQSVTVGTANVTGVNFTGTLRPTSGQTIFTSQTPVSVNLSDGPNVDYELGTIFTSDVGGLITGIRFWKSSQETGAHVGRLWNSAGQLLASVTFANETASGWQQQDLANPVQIIANTQYTVSVNTANSFYVTTAGGLTSPVINLDLRTVAGNNGVFGSPGQYPTGAFQDSNYFRDVVFFPGSFSASGAITPSANGAGATLSLSGPVAGTVTADSTGSFSFGGLSNGNYTVTPSKSGFTFTPPSQSFAISNASVSSLNFTAAPQTYSLSGNISPAASGAGATVSLSGSATATAAADASGNFSFSGLTNGTYTVTPSRSGFTFTPFNQTVSISGANVTGVNFAVTQPVGGTFSISGIVTPAANGAGVTMTLSGANSGTVVTDSGGNFAFTGLANGSYVVTPVKSGFSFSPAQSSITVNNANVSGLNFVATVQVVQTLFTTQTPVDTNQSDGANVNYELGTAFRSDTNGQITAIRFWKDSNESGTHTGRVWSSTGQLLTSVVFASETASGWQQQSLTAPLSITANTTYIVSVNTGNSFYVDTLNGLATAVVNQHLSSIVGGNGVYGSPGQFPTNTYLSSNYFRDIVLLVGGSSSGFAISGSISPASSGSGVSLTLTGAANGSTTADANGNYTFTGLANGTYTITPSATGFSFTPASQTVTINGANVSGVNFTASVAPGPCTPPVTNPVACENTKPGNPSTEWDLPGGDAGDSTIQGFATNISYNLGESASFKITTTASSIHINIYRLGYYGGLGARLIATIPSSSITERNQPNCLTDSSTGLIDCGNWSVSATWAIPTTAVSGVYIAKLIRDDTNGASHLAFIVRDDSSHSDMLFQTSDTAWQAYNDYGGNSLYSGSPAGRAYKVSFNRPFHTRVFENFSWVFNAEYPMIKWLEANGYNVSYFTDVDSDRNGVLIKNHKIFLSVGHDEYWSGNQRANVEAARNAGVNLAFFSGNESFWKTRWENSIDGSGTPYRTLVCYKETAGEAVIDPLDPPIWTGTWRDATFSPPADGGRPENAMSGTIFMVNGPPPSPLSILVPQADGKMRFWRNTAAASLGSGQTYTTPAGVLGYEWDMDLDNGFRPAGLIDMSTTSYSTSSLFLLDNGTSYGSGTPIHHLTLYKHASGALVFGAGTVQWAWGLDSDHDNAGTATDTNMQQATVNLFADMGVQPSTLRPGLVAATASTDTVAPTSTITSPTNGASVVRNTTVTITGTAADTGGGVVGGVEVSTNGGTTWHPANGRGTWTYSWTVPATLGPVTLMSRAVDDSGNLQSAVTSVTVSIVASANSFNISGSVTPAASGSGTVLTLSGAAAGSTTADANGNYSFTALANGNYTVTPSKSGFTFTPINQPVTINGTSVTNANFTASAAPTFSISGTISPSANGSGATVTLTGTATRTVTADASGGFTFTGLANGNYTVTPSKSGFAFSPANQPVTINGTNITGVNFTASAAATFSISGAITPSTSGSGAMVTLTGASNATVTADASGNYTFGGLLNGTYTVTPSKTGFSFTPPSQSVTISSANVANVNFTAQASATSITIDASVFGDRNTNATTVVTSAFSTATPNELLLAFVSADAPASGTNTTVTGITGAGLTWTLVVRTNTQRGTAEIWRAFAASKLTNVTVTATLSRSVPSSITVMTFSGVSTAGTGGSGAVGATKSASAASGAPTGSLVTTRPNSLVVGVGTDWDNPISRTVGSGQILVHQFMPSVGDTYWVQRQLNPTALSGTTVTINDTAPTGDRYNLSLCEILTP